MFKRLVKGGIAAAAAAGMMLLGAPAHADDAAIVTSGAGGILSGNQVVAPVSVPVNVCGNAIAVLGAANAFCKGGAWVGHNHPVHIHKGHKHHVDP